MLLVCDEKVRRMNLSLVFSVISVTIVSCLLAVICRSIAIRKTDVIDKSEVNLAKLVIIGSSILVLIIGILVSGFNDFGFTVAVCWQQPLYVRALLFGL